MKSFFNNVQNAIYYALSDVVAIFVIGGILLVTSLANKYFDSFHASNVIMIFVVGYGSFVTWYASNGSKRHPDIRKIKDLVWEGFKKSIIIGVYTLFLTFFGHHANLFFSQGNFPLAIVCAIIFVAIWMMLVGGLINRYLNQGAFLKAFDVGEIIGLFLSHDLKRLLPLIFSVVVAQVFVVSVFVNFHDGFSILELLYSILTFFLAPFLFIATKRLVGLSIRDLLN